MRELIRGWRALGRERGDDGGGAVQRRTEPNGLGGEQVQGAPEVSSMGAWRRQCPSQMPAALAKKEAGGNVESFI